MEEYITQIIDRFIDFDTEQRWNLFCRITNIMIFDGQDLSENQKEAIKKFLLHALSQLETPTKI